jgi:hypothetical protein
MCTNFPDSLTWTTKDCSHTGSTCTSEIMATCLQTYLALCPAQLVQRLLYSHTGSMCASEVMEHIVYKFTWLCAETVITQGAGVPQRSGSFLTCTTKDCSQSHTGSTCSSEVMETYAKTYLALYLEQCIHTGNMCASEVMEQVYL